jgi:hypothetical protein
LIGLPHEDSMSETGFVLNDRSHYFATFGTKMDRMATTAQTLAFNPSMKLPIS